MKYLYHSIVLSIFFSFITTEVKAQNTTKRIHGQVLFENKTAIPYANILLVGANLQTQTDLQGKFTLTTNSSKSDTLKVTYMGMKTENRILNLQQNKDVELLFILSDESVEIDEVKVYKTSANRAAKNETIKAEIVDTKAVQGQAATLVELMNQSAGVRIRQTGGLGANTNIMLNGFQGKAIKIFKDGIPTDYLGNAFNISAIPINMLERVEVFKGVLPANLGADALGGAVNMVSRADQQRYLALSYEISSFNTHRISANLLYNTPNQKVFWGLNSFYNYSDNNYDVTAGVPDQETANVIPTRVKLFHNTYKQIYGEIFAGFHNLSWADEFRVGLTSFYIKRDNQFAALMEKPYGASYNEQYTPVIPTIRYKKKFLEDRLDVDQFLVYSKINSLHDDTLVGFYDWFGNYHDPINENQRGESGNASLLDVWFTNFTSRTGANYTISGSHNITFNVIYNAYSRNGKDPYGAKSAGENPVDLQSLPADYNKAVATLGLNSVLMEEKLRNTFQVKFYYADMVGQEVDINTAMLKAATTKTNVSTLGVAESLKYDWTRQTFMRISGELATRLPEQSEILGDGSFALSNFSLKPERSMNGNIGFGTGKQGLFDLELNAFYRITKDLIHSVPVNLIYTQNVNVEQVRGIGLEADLHVTPISWLRLNGNFTYQDFRLYHVENPLIRYLEGARLRNMPFFFANLGVDVHFSKIFNKQDQLKMYWNMGYVHQYYLDYIPKNTEPDGFLGLWGKAKVNAPNIIPTQTIQSAGVLWTPWNSRLLSVNFECKNIFDKTIYDNFRVQNAGRSFHLKLNYILKY
ncbi:TonB-dependent receptor [Flavobacterium notoginsengisoli]|uniref:TonB-dependent receptor n=1 Tax=Flavobacterium notoginsengisoli TaxID=1478199 RepID=UPI00363B5BD0